MAFAIITIAASFLSLAPEYVHHNFIKITLSLDLHSSDFKYKIIINTEISEIDWNSKLLKLNAENAITVFYKLINIITTKHIK